MILHLSAALAKKLRAPLSFSNMPVLQTGRADSWSADILKVQGRARMVLVMHDASQWPLLIPIEGCGTYEEFLQLLIIFMAGSYLAFDKPFDHENQEIIVTRRTNRTLIGYMNDAKRCSGLTAIMHLESRGSINWSEITDSLMNTPYSSKNGFFMPRDKFPDPRTA
jgi:hypothetical protein